MFRKWTDVIKCSLCGGSGASSSGEGCDRPTTAELERARESIGSRRHTPPETPDDVGGF